VKPAPSERMDTQQTAQAARGVLTPEAPVLWIRLTDLRSVAAVKALAAGVDPNPVGGAFKVWILVGDAHAMTDTELERAILLRRSAQPRPRADLR
jgi:hypothetical protein